MGNPEGAKAAATLYSLIETAKLNDVNPEGYLRFLLEHPLDANDITLIEQLMPWNANIDNGYIKPSLKPKEAEAELEKNTPQEITIKDTR
ncbi:MAG: transposase domain-containing protein [Alphaproteobacteria bacterium]|nr:transposase domain-containing protein [Alphaproteobacteria bacterium]